MSGDKRGHDHHERRGCGCSGYWANKNQFVAKAEILIVDSSKDRTARNCGIVGARESSSSFPPPGDMAAPWNLHCAQRPEKYWSLLIVIILILPKSFPTLAREVLEGNQDLIDASRLQSKTQKQCPGSISWPTWGFALDRFPFCLADV